MFDIQPCGANLNPNPLSHEDGGLGWQLRYGGVEARDKLAVVAAGEVDMLEHLVRDYSMTEVTDRLRRMRRAYRAINEAKSDLVKMAALQKEAQG